MTTNLHGPHCYEKGVLVCGWPEFHHELLQKLQKVYPAKRDQK